MKLVGDYRSGAAVLEDLKSLARVHEPTRRFLDKIGVEVAPEDCYICGSLLNDVEKYAKNVVDVLKDIDFETFSIGTTIPREILEREAEVVKSFMVTTGESIKHEINRRIGREVMKLLGKRVDKLKPQVVARINLPSGDVSVLRNPVLIGGTYLKLSRQMSQVKKFGNVRVTLFEKLQYLRELFGGVEHLIHAAGREDVDVRTLGNGRPVVVEVKQPSRYNFSPPPLVDREVVFIPSGVAGRTEIRRLKEKSKVNIKTYRVLVACEKPLDDLSTLSMLRGKTVTQLTPRRIKRLNPRGKRVRMVYEISWRQLTPHVFELYVRCQGGLYVKEFIHGDGGRTKPSVAEILNTNLEVIELDVLAIE